MGSRILLLRPPLSSSISSTLSNKPNAVFLFNKTTTARTRTIASIASSPSSSTTSSSSSLPPPDVLQLSQTARISLSPQEVDEFAPKIRQVIDWFGQLQSVDLNSVEPSLRADTEGRSLHDDISRIFENREAITAAIPSYEAPFIKVPKVLNKD